MFAIDGEDGVQYEIDYIELQNRLVDEGTILLTMADLSAQDEGDGILPSCWGATPAKGKRKKMLDQEARYGKGKVNENTWRSVESAIRECENVNDKVGAQEWREARSEERRKMFKVFKAWEWTALLPGERPGKLQEPARLKLGEYLHKQTKKVRTVIMGNLLKPPVGEKFLVFAAVVVTADVMLLLGIATAYRLHVFGLDAVSAFLQAPAPYERMVFTPLPGMEPDDPAKKFLLATRNIYGHPCASRQYQEKTWKPALRTLGFVPVDREECIWLLYHEQNFACCATIVDDTATITSDESWWNEVFARLQKLVVVEKDTATRFAGLEIDYDREKGIMKVRQTKGIITSAGRFSINENTKRVESPMAPGESVKESDCPAPEDVDPADVESMQSMLGSMQYITLVQPELKLPILELGRVALKPGQKHLAMARRALTWMNQERNTPIVFTDRPWRDICGTMRDPRVPVYKSDTAFNEVGRDVQTRSRTGWVGMIAGAIFDSGSSRQKIVADSTAYAELIAAHETGKRAVSVRNIMEKLPFCRLIVPIPLEIDASATLALVNITSNNSRSRHFQNKYFWLREAQQEQRLQANKVHTFHQGADGFTKSLPLSRFRVHYFVQHGLAALSDDELKEIGWDRIDCVIDTSKEM